jgi:SEC-C motif-containing protein
MKCPCHSGKLYAECCAPYHEGEKPPTPLALMRSRYSAYALSKSAYIISTTHPDHPDSRLPLGTRKKQIKEFSRKTQFKGLEILETHGSTVTFKAILAQQGHDDSFIEKSDFAQVDGRWLYLCARLHQSE